MKFEPLDKSYVNGCLNCSKSPEKILTLDEEIDCNVINIMYTIKIYINEHEYDKYLNVENKCTLAEIIKEYKKDIDICDSFCIEIKNVLNGEIYEFNKEDNLFYLVEQTNGWA